MLTDLVRSEVRAALPGARLPDIPKGALVQFVVGALMSILIWWLDENAKLPPAEADAIFRRLVIGAIVKD